MYLTTFFMLGTFEQPYSTSKKMIFPMTCTDKTVLQYLVINSILLNLLCNIYVHKLCVIIVSENSFVASKLTVVSFLLFFIFGWNTNIVFLFSHLFLANLQHILLKVPSVHWLWTLYIRLLLPLHRLFSQRSVLFSSQHNTHFIGSFFSVRENLHNFLRLHSKRI